MADIFPIGSDGLAARDMQMRCLVQIQPVVHAAIKRRSRRYFRVDRSCWHRLEFATFGYIELAVGSDPDMFGTLPTSACPCIASLARPGGISIVTTAPMVDYKIHWLKMMSVPESQAVVGRHDGINGMDSPNSAAFSTSSSV